MPEASFYDLVLLDRDFDISYKKNTTHRMLRPHFHDGYEIHLTLNHETYYYVDERKYVGDVGSVAIFNAQELHRVTVPEGSVYERYVILFKPRFLAFATAQYPELLLLFSERFPNFENVVRLNNVELTKLLNLLNELIRISSNDVFLQELKLKQKLLEVVLFLDDIYLLKDNLKDAISYHKEDVLSNVVAYIKANYAEDITLVLLSQQFFISRSTLTRLFKNHIGMTPAAYIGYVRVIESTKLLKRGYTVKEVARRVGYRDDSTFIKKFHSIKGISPKQYILREGRKLEGGRKD
ncbi:AraC family transcriptional regulator [Lacticaseibacillus jixiensis]|uniref:AraC family transcriptional regulator n=1 Tax=Lacticaseibacillus jixiensis TaxID=3231926 RepID=UPI0036F2512D